MMYITIVTCVSLAITIVLVYFTQLLSITGSERQTFMLYLCFSSQIAILFKEQPCPKPLNIVYFTHILFVPFNISPYLLCLPPHAKNYCAMTFEPSARLALEPGDEEGWPLSNARPGFPTPETKVCVSIPKGCFSIEPT